MAQTNFPYMLSIDWLQLSLTAADELYGIESFDCFICSQRDRGSKQYKNITDVNYISSDGELIPFGVFLSTPTLATWSPLTCALKLDNSLLYNSVDGGWFAVLGKFVRCYNLTISHIQRCDLACDFLYLKGRLSGSQLCHKIKSMEYWKCGSVNVSEHYTMPYSIKWQRDISLDGYESEIYLQSGSLSPRVESLTFGRLSSGAQVCLYDKTLELKSHEITIDGKKVCSKQYIRDNWVNANVFHVKRHTWRLEIRLTSQALFIFDSKDDKERRITISDIIGDALKYTFLMAIDRYFRLVDFTIGGTQPVSVDRCFAMSTHKNRLPIVNLFDCDGLNCQMCRAKYHLPCNRFNRSVVTRLQSLSSIMSSKESILSTYGLKDKVESGIKSLGYIANNREAVMANVSDCIRLLKEITFNCNAYGAIPQEHIDNLVDLRRSMEYMLRTESPRFVKMMINDVCRVKKSVDIIRESEFIKGREQITKPMDSQILTDSVRILQSLYSPSVRDQRKEDTANLYKERLYQIVQSNQNNRSWTEPEYDYIRFCLGKDSPLSFSEISQFKEMNYNANIQSTCTSLDYAQYLHFRKDADPDFMMPKYKPIFN